jgi:alanine dehydrogenase
MLLSEPMRTSTYIIKRPQIEKIFGMSDYIAAIEEAFKLYGEGKVQMPPKLYLSFPKGDLRCMPVYIPPLNIVGVKNVNVHPANKDLPTVMATITLFDPETGFPIAIMDGTLITKMRTGAAGAVAAKYLSREDSKTAAFIGTGVQARTQLEGLLNVRHGITKINAYDVDAKSADNFAQHVKANYSLVVEPAGSVEEAVLAADIVTTTTPVRSPIVKAQYISKGTHINAIGADAPGKQELEIELLKNARIVIDNWEQSSHAGEINVAVSKNIISREDIYADIGEIVTGKKPARESTEMITIFDSTGLAIQDIYSACMIFRALVSNEKTEAELEKISFFSRD